VLIMYFWSALIAFGALAYSVNSASMWIVLGIVVLCAIGLVLLLLPRFTPRAPVWAERFVPPRYRRRRRVVTEPAARLAHSGDGEGTDRTPVAAGTPGVSGVNGATAIGPRARLHDRRKAGTSR
jgi:UDP-GlcNAc:undecaprenyl-phosphate GlcNAc-1-phosphate transferase